MTTTKHPELDQKRFAKDVARAMEAQRRRRRVLVTLLVIGAIVAAVLYLTCGKGWGVGGKGEGAGSGPGPGPGSAAPLLTPVDAGVARCALRLSEAGLTVDGKPATRDEAIATCKARPGGAEVLVTGDARQGDWDDLRAALDAAGIAYTTREPRGATPPGAGAPEEPVGAGTAGPPTDAGTAPQPIDAGAARRGPAKRRTHDGGLLWDRAYSDNPLDRAY